ncbi:MAG: protein kinase [Desulfarculaceae bacterium]|nr:protein kinase [Desulfarculaceae bacterium]
MNPTQGRDPCPVCKTRANYSNQPPALRVGTILGGKYLVGRCLGRGGFGITYLGQDQLKRKVVIKEFFPKKIAKRSPGETVITPERNDLTDNYERGIATFLNEMITLAKFDDPNIGKIYDHFRENKTAYFVAPFKDGVTLEEFARRQPGGMSEETLLEIIQEILNGLEKVHDANIVHRDIKPSNIFLPKAESPFLIDFGNARDFEISSRMTVLLTHGYAPQEQYSENFKRGKQGPWTDIYACAATMYACLQKKRSESGGLVPPPSAPDRAGGASVADIHRVSSRSISRQTARAIMLGLELNTNRRPRSVADFRRLLFSGQTVVETPKSYELLCLAGEFEGESFPLFDSPMMIGRSGKACNLVLSDIALNRNISRKHCQVWTMGGKVMLRDLDSTHGTVVNETAKIAGGGTSELAKGDCFSLAGNIVFEVVAGQDDVAGGKKPRQPYPGGRKSSDNKHTIATDLKKTGAVRRLFKKVLFQ